MSSTSKQPSMDEIKRVVTRWVDNYYKLQKTNKWKGVCIEDYLFTTIDWLQPNPRFGVPDVDVIPSDGTILKCLDLRNLFRWAKGFSIENDTDLFIRRLYESYVHFIEEDLTCIFKYPKSCHGALPWYTGDDEEEEEEDSGDDEEGEETAEIMFGSKRKGRVKRLLGPSNEEKEGEPTGPSPAKKQKVAVNDFDEKAQELLSIACKSRAKLSMLEERESKLKIEYEKAKEEKEQAKVQLSVDLAILNEHFDSFL